MKIKKVNPKVIEWVLDIYLNYPYSSTSAVEVEKNRLKKFKKLLEQFKFFSVLKSNSRSCFLVKIQAEHPPYEK